MPPRIPGCVRPKLLVARSIAFKGSLSGHARQDTPTTTAIKGVRGFGDNSGSKTQSSDSATGEGTATSHDSVRGRSGSGYDSSRLNSTSNSPLDIFAYKPSSSSPTSPRQSPAVSPWSNPSRSSKAAPDSTSAGFFRLPKSNPIDGLLSTVKASEDRLRERRALQGNTRRAAVREEPKPETLDELRDKFRLADLVKRVHRRWRPGDVYTSKDLGTSEYERWRKKQKPDRDVFDVLGFQPLSAYKNFAIMSEYMTPMGRIKPIHETGLRPVNQRRMAKAIRRSVGLGLMPSVHRHPEILFAASKMSHTPRSFSPQTRA